MEGFLFIVACVMLFVAMFMANKFQEIAEMKGHKERYWAWCFWMPVYGIPMVIALPDLKLRESVASNGKVQFSQNSDINLEKAANDIKGYKDLLDAGVITQKEFDKVKTEIMSKVN